jgi:hypothetical protein
VSNQVEIIYSSSRNSKETGEIIRISPRKSARGIRPLRVVRRGALAKSISELAPDWLVLTPDIVFLPCFYGIRLWIWPEPIAPRVRRALGTRMQITKKTTSKLVSIQSLNILRIISFRKSRYLL